jgi:uncharacterized protein (DUF983 family)
MADLETDAIDRPMGQSMLRGLAGRCPRCGGGALFGRYLKVAERCEACGEPFEHRHRADDFPAYVVIFLVGHIVVPLMLLADGDMHWPIWVHVAIWPTLALVLSLVLLQPVKGALVAWQWSRRMHGFSSDRPSDAAGGGH